MSEMPSSQRWFANRCEEYDRTVNGIGIPKRRYNDYPGIDDLLEEMDANIIRIGKLNVSANNIMVRTFHESAIDTLVGEKAALIQRYQAYVADLDSTVHDRIEEQAQKYMAQEQALRALYSSYEDELLEFEQHPQFESIRDGPDFDDPEMFILQKLARADIPSIWEIPHSPERIMNVSAALVIIYGYQVKGAQFGVCNDFTPIQ